MSEEKWYLAYRHTDGREMRLELKGFGYSTMDPEQLKTDVEYQTINKAFQRLAKRVMK